MNYLKPFKSFTSEEDFEEIDKNEYTEMCVGDLEDYDSFDDMKWYIENRYIPFTKEELIKLRQMITVRRQPFTNQTIRNCISNSCSLLYMNDYQTLEIKKFKDNWFAVHLHGEKDVSNYEASVKYKCDEWVGLIKCLRHLKSKCGFIK